MTKDKQIICKCNDKECGQCSFEEQLKAKEQECEKLREERNEYFELMAIRTEVLVKIANKLGINTAIIENKEIFNKIDQLKTENEQLKKAEEYDSRYNDLQAEIDCGNTIIEKYEKCLTEIKEIAKPYQKDIDKICGNCRRYDGCHACCMDTLNNYEYRTGTTKACDKFIELKDFDINKLAKQILQKISEVEE